MSKRVARYASLHIGSTWSRDLRQNYRLAAKGVACTAANGVQGVTGRITVQSSLFSFLRSFRSLGDGPAMIDYADYPEAGSECSADSLRARLSAARHQDREVLVSCTLPAPLSGTRAPALLIISLPCKTNRKQAGEGG